MDIRQVFEYILNNKTSNIILKSIYSNSYTDFKAHSVNNIVLQSINTPYKFNQLSKLFAKYKITKKYDEYRHQAEEIQQELAKMNKNYELPSTPKKITEKSLDRIKKYTEDEFIKNKLKRQERSKRIKNKYSIITTNYYNWIVEMFSDYMFFDDFYIEWQRRVAPNNIEYIGKAIEKAFPNGYISFYKQHYKTHSPKEHFYEFLADMIAEVEKVLNDILPNGLPNYSEEKAELTQDEYNMNEIDYDTVLNDKRFHGYFNLPNGSKVNPFTGEVIKDE